MHYSSAAILLLLVPATRAAAIPIQGGPLDLEDPLHAVRPDAVPDLTTGLVDGLAATKRDGATGLDPLLQGPFPGIVVGVVDGVEKEVGGIVLLVAGGGVGAQSKRSAPFDPAKDLLVVVDILAGETAQLGRNAAAGPATVKRNEADGFVKVIIDDTANLEKTAKDVKILDRDEATNLVGSVVDVPTQLGKVVAEVPVDLKAEDVKILKRKEAAILLTPISDVPAKVEETVTQVANNAVAGVATTKRDADADALANSIRKLSYEQIGALVNLLKVIGGRDTATSKRSAPMIPEELRNELSLLLTGKPFSEQTNAIEPKRDITGTEVAGSIAYAEKLAAGPAGQLADLQNGVPLGSIGRRDVGDALEPPTAAADVVGEVASQGVGETAQLGDVTALVDGVVTKQDSKLSEAKVRGRDGAVDAVGSLVDTATGPAGGITNGALDSAGALIGNAEGGINSVVFDAGGLIV
ncbi:hypothetical protein VF21_00529 [Pseudogymnoascus sp. 05NY08]|nr:hypothetical protein VF21_00529 [Pseudogymnoascus sp. 05NY08]